MYQHLIYVNKKLSDLMKVFFVIAVIIILLRLHFLHLHELVLLGTDLFIKNLL